MRNVDSIAVAAGVVLAFDFGCLLGGALTSPPVPALGGVWLLVAQFVACALYVPLRLAYGRVAPAAAPRAVLAILVAGWGFALVLFWRRSGPVAALLVPLWLATFVSADALCARRCQTDGCAGCERAVGCPGGCPRAEVACRPVADRAHAAEDDRRPDRAEHPGTRAARHVRAARKSVRTDPDDSGISGDFETACADLERECRLSRREAEVLRYAARGYRPGFIANRIGTAESTVRSHMRNIYRKTACASSEQLVEEVEARAARVRSARLVCSGRRRLPACRGLLKRFSSEGRNRSR